MKNELPGEHICTEHTADDVAQVWHIVDVGQRTRDQHVPLSLLRETKARHTITQQTHSEILTGHQHARDDNEGLCV